MTFTDLAFDGTSIVWRITHHYHAVPDSMAHPARSALAALDEQLERQVDAQMDPPVAFVASGGGAVALHSGGVPFGAGPAARVLAQASARLSPPSRLIVITSAGRWAAPGRDAAAPVVSGLVHDSGRRSGGAGGRCRLAVRGRVRGSGSHPNGLGRPPVRGHEPVARIHEQCHGRGHDSRVHPRVGGRGTRVAAAEAASCCGVVATFLAHACTFWL